MLRYSEIDASDGERMTLLYKTYLNDGETVQDWFEAGLSQGDYAGAKCMDAERAVGVFSARPGIEFTCGHEDIVRQLEETYRGEKIFTADMLAVLPEYRGHGVARQLAWGLRDSLKKHGCEKLIVEAWERSIKHDTPVGGVVKYLSPHIKVFGEYLDFYQNLAQYSLTCPECGGSDCKCGALVLVLDI